MLSGGVKEGEEWREGEKKRESGKEIIDVTSKI